MASGIIRTDEQSIQLDRVVLGVNVSNEFREKVLDYLATLTQILRNWFQKIYSI